MYVVVTFSFSQSGFSIPQYSFTVQSSPSDTLALTNCLIVHPADFKDGEHVLVKGEFPLTVR